MLSDSGRLVKLIFGIDRLFCFHPCIRGPTLKSKVPRISQEEKKKSCLFLLASLKQL